MAQIELRFFVDDRCGCVAVRDRTLTDPEYQGLHADTEGVVKFWMRRPESKYCPTCHHNTGFGYIDGGELNEAHALAEQLNSEDQPTNNYQI